MSEHEKFQLNIVLESMKSSLIEDDDVKQKEYLVAYNEFNKFFNSMGTVFGLVSSDLSSKIGILNEFLENKDLSINFLSTKSMITYELEKGLLDKKDYVSGSRTLLRLHRGLEFIRLFLKRISELQESDNTAEVSKECYRQTLAKHHPFLIKTGALVAMTYMPNKDVLLQKVCGEEDEKIWAMLELLPETLDVTQIVYDRIDSLYTRHNLHSLP